MLDVEELIDSRDTSDGGSGMGREEFEVLVHKVMKLLEDELRIDAVFSSGSTGE